VTNCSTGDTSAHPCTGSYALAKGGSLVTLTDGNDYVVVIEKMSYSGTQTAWKGFPPYNTSAENITISLPFSGANLAVWRSHLPATEVRMTLLLLLVLVLLLLLMLLLRPHRARGRQARAT